HDHQRRPHLRDGARPARAERHLRGADGAEGALRRPGPAADRVSTASLEEPEMTTAFRTSVRPSAWPGLLTAVLLLVACRTARDPAEERVTRARKGQGEAVSRWPGRGSCARRSATAR